MRLRKIKLAGFKSFVDPTTVDLPGDLVAVVGPNGCGKSNIIDAVRWVMGEISARHLRGESMADVVFNGSGSRKPVSQASVELVFDNSDGRLEGRMAAYNEVAVRREVTREGNSSYFLNGVRCRRRDVMDVFLGTGLGPRSYAIIEQGMISRVIEAKPEELRDFLEEAAGISKYKERRRETETRMRHTQENLDRLTDLRDELGRRLTHLKRQATIAEKYKLLRAEERTLARQLEALRWSQLDAECTTHTEQIARQENLLEAALAEQRRSESQIEHQRAEHVAASDRYNECYREVLEAGAAVARREESITALRGRSESLAGELEREREQLALSRTEAQEDELREQGIAEQLNAIEPRSAELEQQLNDASEQLEIAESEMLRWQTEFQQLSEQASEPQRAVLAERVRIEELETREAGLRDRLHQIQRQLADMDRAPLDAELEQVTEMARVAEESLVEAEQQKSSLEQRLRDSRTRARDEQDAVHELQQLLQSARGKESSLDVLQRQALGRSREQVVEWLSEQGLNGAARLAEQISVREGWEAALEAVLGARLEAVLVEDIDRLSRSLTAAGDALEGASITLITAESDTSIQPSVAPNQALIARGLSPLLSLVDGPSAISAWLDGVYVCADHQLARDARGLLTGNQQIVVRDGTVYGPRWLATPDAQSAQAGVLARARDLENLRVEIESASMKLTERRSALEEAREQSETLEVELAEQQMQISQLHRSGADNGARKQALHAQIERFSERQSTLEDDRDELMEQLESLADSLYQARSRLETSVTSAEELGQRKRAYEAEREPRRARLHDARAKHQQVRDQAYQHKVQAESLRGEQENLNATRRRLRERMAYLETRCSEIEQQRDALSEPLQQAQDALGAELETRRTGDERLKQLREAAELAEQAVSQIDRARQSSVEKVEQARQALGDMRLNAEQARVRRQTVAEALQAEGVEPADVLREIEVEEPSIEDFEKQLQDLGARISRLGAINLAAIEEYDQQSERKIYLDSQHADLSEALETLQGAIAKIDRETRARFKETYEQVNSGMQRIFPTLFGGGEAELRMTDGDLLTTGVSVMARPPGKRNSSIQLLSGGEKALTAVAFTFAIFELNPAPFCLLDEVDAPLDDANVSRFSRLVKSMSDRVQMLLISHNKLTMETANQLIGVTMHEPGVSRLVAVDIDQAVEMASA